MIMFSGVVPRAGGNFSLDVFHIDWLLVEYVLRSVSLVSMAKTFPAKRISYEQDALRSELHGTYGATTSGDPVINPLVRSVLVKAEWLVNNMPMIQIVVWYFIVDGVKCLVKL